MAKDTVISAAAANAQIATHGGLYDAGATAAKLRIYGGTKPANPDTPTAEIVLVEVPLNDPAFQASGSTGQIQIAGATPLTATAAASGTGTWFRVLDSNDLAINDGTVGTSDADLILSSVNITSGDTVNINTWTITQPIQ